MATNNYPPRVKFHAHHLPKTPPGKYELKVSHVVRQGDDVLERTPVHTLNFEVFGERFSIHDNLVRAQFPQPGSTGEYAAVLPHIVIKRNTLPWERKALKSDEGKGIPWMALLLFDENEVPRKEVATFSTPMVSKAQLMEAADTKETIDEEEKFTIINVPKETLEKILPTQDELKLLAHTRQGVEKDTDTVIGEEVAVVFGNRLPRKGVRSVVHLVSLENRYSSDGFIYPAADEPVQLVSLRSWEFFTLEHFKITSAVFDQVKDRLTGLEKAGLSKLIDREFAGTEESFWEEITPCLDPSEKDPKKFNPSYKNDLIALSEFKKTFDGILKNLGKDILTCRLPESENPKAEDYLAQGYVPAEHHFRSGDQSVSWFRGPFLPFKPAEDKALKEHYQVADDLLKYDAELGMFDVSYAAAWELGRMLSLANRDFSVSLFNWKRQQKHQSHLLKQLKPGISHLPRLRNLSPPHANEATDPLWELHIQPWLTQLAQLETIPPNYLIPNEQLLPRESIRFFHVDRNWQVALLKGALSIDHHTGGESKIEAFLSLNERMVTGFLLRSDVVAGWPGLIFDGLPGPGSDQAVKHKLVSRQLSRNVILCLYGGEIERVEVHQKPEVMHFGFVQTETGYLKFKRNERDEKTDRSVPVNFKEQDQGLRVVDLLKLKELLALTNDARFGMNMIEGIPKVIFEISNPQQL